MTDSSQGDPGGSPTPGAPPLPYLEEGIGALEAAWQVLAPAGASGSLEDDLEASTDAALMAWAESLGTLLRQVLSIGAFAAAEVERRSAGRLGAESFARMHAYRSAADLIHDVLGVHPGDGKMLVRVGLSVTSRRRLIGERGPAAAPHVAEAMQQGTLGLAAANEIVQMRDRLEGKVDRADVEAGERMLVNSSADLTLNGLKKSVARVEAHIFPDGVAPRIDEQRDARSLIINEHGDGSISLKGRFDPVTAAPIRSALNGYVTHHIRKNRGNNAADAHDLPKESAAGNGSQKSPKVEFVPTEQLRAEQSAESVSGTEISRLLADALAAISKHALGCETNAVPGASTKVMVRIPVESIMSREVFEKAQHLGEIDGAGLLDAGTARIIAASAGIIPVVLGTSREILDVGREQRMFSKPQREALVERDGGCAFCGLHPSMTEAHHIEWWNAHSGKTDLDNGVLLCMTCHHRIHDGWDVRVVPETPVPRSNLPESRAPESNLPESHAPESHAPPGGNRGAGTVWFFPPTHVDPHGTPRLGGRKRFDPVFRELYEPSPPPGWQWTGTKAIRTRSRAA